MAVLHHSFISLSQHYLSIPMPWAGTCSCSLTMPPLVFSPLSISFLFILETQVILERQMFLFARPCGMTCFFRRLLPFFLPYRVTASLTGHCGRLRKRRGKSKRRLRIKWRWIPGGVEEAGESHLLTQFQMTLLGSVRHERKEFVWWGKENFMFKRLSAHMP